ncbi:MAG: hypothetical protein EOM08_10430 [Clostridia bacterium]|nr:hypothetical protein [Clostridia bacterium]NCC76835.1 hypothetical protein [Clostridia bacterium]
MIVYPEAIKARALTTPVERPFRFVPSSFAGFHQAQAKQKKRICEVPVTGCLVFSCTLLAKEKKGV